MGQWHQALIIAKVKPHDGEKPRYRCLGSIYHSWCYGSLPVKGGLRERSSPARTADDKPLRRQDPGHRGAPSGERRPDRARGAGWDLLHGGPLPGQRREARRPRLGREGFQGATPLGRQGRGLRARDEPRASRRVRRRGDGAFGHYRGDDCCGSNAERCDQECFVCCSRRLLRHAVDMSDFVQYIGLCMYVLLY